jgi:peroxiredoxin
MALTFTPLDNIGMPFPEFNLPAVDGKNFSSSEFLSAQAKVIMFICNHCPYVKAIEDRLITLGHDLKKINIPLIAICSNDPQEYPEDNFEALKKRAEEKKYPFVYLHDPDQKVAQQFGAVCTPDFFVFDRDNKLGYRGRLDDSWKNPDLVKRRELFEAVQEILKQNYVSFTQTPSMGCNIKWSLS